MTSPFDRSRRSHSLASLVLGLPLASLACTAPDPIETDAVPPADARIRSGFYTGSEEKVGDLLTPHIEMRHKDTGREVTLLGMVHYADGAFYDHVNALCDESDVVLIEGVRGSPSLGPFLFVSTYVFAIQRRLGYLGDLVAQSEGFQRTAKWKNGDVDLAEWQNDMPWYTPLAQTVVGPLVVVLFEPLTLLGWVNDSLAEATFTSRNAELRVRALWAGILTDDEDDDDDNGGLIPGIIGQRNEHLLSELDRTFQNEKIRHAVLPWGAAHLPGLVEGLKKRGYEVTKTEWMRCWSIKSALNDEKLADPATFYIPWVVSWRSHLSTHTLALAFESIFWQSRSSGAWRFELLWDLLWSQSGDSFDDSNSFRLGPKLFGVPLLIERDRIGENARWRFLLFGRVGNLGETDTGD